MEPSARTPRVPRPTSSSSPRASQPRRTWIYDARANVPKITKKSRPLTAKHFAEFEKCYGDDPNGLSKRSESDSTEDRWRSFTIDEVKEHHYKLDAFKWIRDEELDDPDELPEPEELITEAMEELQLALDDLADISVSSKATEMTTSIRLMAGMLSRSVHALMYSTGLEKPVNGRGERRISAWVSAVLWSEQVDRMDRRSRSSITELIS